MTPNEMYEAVVNNDGTFDGKFFYGVKSTGIFCRPSCPSKKPLRENVCFFHTAQEAIAAGFRPCKRCRSDLTTYEPQREVAKMIKERLDHLPAYPVCWSAFLHELGLSIRWADALFQDIYQMTPKKYVDRLRLKTAKQLLLETDQQAIKIADLVGFEGGSAFHRFFRMQTGESPLAYRKKNRNVKHTEQEITER